MHLLLFYYAILLSNLHIHKPHVPGKLIQIDTILTLYNIHLLNIDKRLNKTNKDQNR